MSKWYEKREKYLDKAVWVNQVVLFLQSFYDWTTSVSG